MKFMSGTRLNAMISTTALALALTAASHSLAATPADTLVVGFAIDDVITLDPAESFEFSTAEILANAYNKLVVMNPENPTQINGDVAESWTVSDDGKTFTFKLKPDLKFASGNPLSAEDVAFSFERAVKLDKGPAFLFTQLGLSADNVTEKAKAVDDQTFELNVDRPYAPSFVLNVLTSSIGSVVDKKLLTEKAKSVAKTDDYKFDTDFGAEFLKTGYAGSGPYKIIAWKPNEAIALDTNPNFYGEAPKLQRVIYRHMKEGSSQRLALEKGDIDIARNLEPGDLSAVAQKDGLKVISAPKSTVSFLSLNEKNPHFAKPEVREAIKYLIDYEAIGDTLIKDIGTIHQTFLPEGQLGALNDKPYALNVEKAKELLAKAGVPEGFSVSIDVRNIQPFVGITENLQQTFAQAGVNLEIISGDGKQVLTKCRARQHDICVMNWGSDYFDPHSNASTFTVNPDNSDQSSSKTIAWRSSWDVGPLGQKTEDALLEKDTEKRAGIYEELQRTALEEGPYAFLYQKTEVAGYSDNVKNFKLGPSFDTNFVYTITKD